MIETPEPNEAELRLNHDFVVAFETLRKRYGHREMGDDALRHIADETGTPFATIRTARHLRNALAHADAVNRQTLAATYEELVKTLGLTSAAVVSSPTTPVRSARSSAADRAYRIHAWTDADLERQMLANGFISIGGSEIGDLSGAVDLEVIRAELTRTMPERTSRAIGLFVGYWRRFLHDAQAGDLVVLPLRDGTVAIGEFVGPYHYVASDQARARHRRAVSWNAMVSREEFEHDLVITLNGQHTVQEFKALRAVERLRVLMQKHARS